MKTKILGCQRPPSARCYRSFDHLCSLCTRLPDGRPLHPAIFSRFGTTISTATRGLDLQPVRDSGNDNRYSFSPRKSSDGQESFEGSSGRTWKGSAKQRQSSTVLAEPHQWFTHHGSTPFSDTSLLAERGDGNPIGSFPPTFLRLQETVHSLCLFLVALACLPNHLIVLRLDNFHHPAKALTLPFMIHLNLPEITPGDSGPSHEAIRHSEARAVKRFR
ncbi:hypothetical protein FA13DRAFT_281447 [Coprinellus micaceus]|uniref:Uncharacterized protein n=1 Tax=Coprinellus micaceus TaxID=71717 RepID=A0A4Y7SEF5_COPMI|nr:hypothetical protein FA13DRAFT_281447 [Coprinellus micaceus]